MLKVGIIGLGGVSEAHLNAYPEVTGITVVAAAEPRQERLEASEGQQKERDELMIQRLEADLEQTRKDLD